MQKKSHRSWEDRWTGDGFVWRFCLTPNLRGLPHMKNDSSVKPTTKSMWPRWRQLVYGWTVTWMNLAELNFDAFWRTLLLANGTRHAEFQGESSLVRFFLRCEPLGDGHQLFSYGFTYIYINTCRSNTYIYIYVYYHIGIYVYI